MPVVVLDRDGVINFDSPDYIKSPAEWVPIPGSIEAIALISSKGYDIFIATNQAGIGRGIFSRATLDAMHQKLQLLVNQAGGRIRGIHFCPHHPDDECRCRKPGIGLLEQIETASGESLAGQPFVGDSKKDIEAGATIGCQPILVLTGNGRETRKELNDTDIPVFDDLLSFAESLRDKGKPGATEA